MLQGATRRRNGVSADIFDAVEVRARDIGLEQRDAVIVLGGKGVRCDEHLFFSLLLIGVMSGKRVRPTKKGRTF